MGPRGPFRGWAIALLLSSAMHSSASAQTTASAASAGWQATPASVMKSALRTVAAAQLRYFQGHKAYASSAGDLSVQAETDVQVQILAAGPNGWQARAVHRLQQGKSCVIFVGSVEGVESPRTDADREMAGEEGVPLCDWMR
jgi:hypothetical protein